MIRAFAARIALLNALLAVVLFAIIGSIAAFVTYASLQNAMSQNLAQAERDVPIVVGYYRLTTLGRAATMIVKQLRRPGVRVLVHDDASQLTFDGARDAGFRERGLGVRVLGGPEGPPADGRVGSPADGREGSPADGREGSPADGREVLEFGDPGFAPGFRGAPAAGASSGEAPPFGGDAARDAPFPPISKSTRVLFAFLHVDAVRVVVRGGSVTLLPDPSTLGSVWQIFALAMALAGLLAALAAWGIGGYASRQSLRPLREVTSELERFGAGDFAPRKVDALDRGEFAGLAQAYNRAAGQVARALEERTNAERDMRQFIADAAHELRTPLTIVTGYVELLRGGVDAAQAEQIFATIGFEGERMRECIAKLLALARLDSNLETKRERVDVSALAERVSETFARVAETCRVTAVVEPGVTVMGDPSELQEALTNLLDNALKYGDGAGVCVRLASDGEDAVLSVADAGPGMTEFEAEHAFKRFYRGEARGERDGSGLGLAIVARIVERAGGTISLSTAPNLGATFAIRLRKA